MNLLLKKLHRGVAITGLAILGLVGCESDRPPEERRVGEPVVIFEDDFAQNRSGWSDVLVEAEEDTYATILPDEEEVFDFVWLIPGTGRSITSSLYLRPAVDLSQGPARVTLRFRGTDYLVQGERFGMELHGAAGEQSFRLQLTPEQPPVLRTSEGETTLEETQRLPQPPITRPSEIRLSFYPNRDNTVSVRIQYRVGDEEEFRLLGVASGVPMHASYFDDLRIFYSNAEMDGGGPGIAFGGVMVEQQAYR